MAVEKQIPTGGEAVLRFDDVTFNHGENKPILFESSFVVRRGTKLTLMGQNGAGKSTLFSMIMGELPPEAIYSSYKVEYDSTRVFGICF